MRYKVWIEIEGVPATTAEIEADKYVDAGELGVLPDPLGEFDSLKEAMRMQADVVRQFNPSALSTSDVANS